VRLGSSVEVDVGAYDERRGATKRAAAAETGGVATAAWAPAKPSRTLKARLPVADEYEVRVYDSRRGRKLVAAVEFVSPSNKDRPETRHAFVAKCAALLRERVTVAVVDVVTERAKNLYRELLKALGQPDRVPVAKAAVYAVVCRYKAHGAGRWRFEAWEEPLELGQPLPTLTLWVGDELVVPLELEASYEETCRVVRVA
jgi:hypothetical protein